MGLNVRELIRQTCQAFEIEILKGVVSKDHVHLFVSAPPTLAPSEIISRIPSFKNALLGSSFLGKRLILCDIGRFKRRKD